MTTTTTTTSTTTTTTTNTLTSHIPTISSSALLVELSIGVWTGRKLDKDASKAVADQNGAVDHAMHVIKKLMPDNAELDMLSKHAAVVRQMNAEWTLPWSDSNQRLLPTKKFFEHNDALVKFRDRFYDLVDQFVASYSAEVRKARASLGAAFNPDEYPDAEKLRKKFYFRFSYSPVPESGDFRLDLGAEAIAALRADYDRFMAQSHQRAMADAWARCHEAISRLVERLDYTGDSDKKIFRDSTVEAVQGLVEMLESFNITDDPVMAAAARDIRNAMLGIRPDDLRKDADVRRDTRARMEEIMRGLPSLEV